MKSLTSGKRVRRSASREGLVGEAPVIESLEGLLDREALLDQAGLLDPEQLLEASPPPATVMREMIEQLIRERAHQLYNERGGQEGRAEEDWYAAEQEVLQRLNRAAA